MNPTDYVSPLSKRYASKEMSHIFSAHFKFSSWRRLWVALAEAQQQLGLAISEAQIEEMKCNIANLSLERAEEIEKELRHDVMAHVKAFGEQCPAAKPIIHLGATSCFVTDNTELIQMIEGLKILRDKLIQLLKQFHQFADDYRSLPCLAYTHLQPAQPTTVGKRATLWLQDFLIDFHELIHRMQSIPFLGVKGATGTQASFLYLFNGDHSKVLELEKKVAGAMGFEKVLNISGQTYPRKLDVLIFDVLSGIAVSAHKFGTDLRLLAHFREIEEPFESTQVGSSAMPHKRNPMRSERICGLARFILSLSDNPRYTASLQWLERTLDDSANRRLSIPEGFLAADALLNLLLNITSGLVVNEPIIKKRLNEELPFLVTENILMEGVKKGGDRQHLHERLRHHTMEAAKKLRLGEPHLLQEALASDPEIALSSQEITHFFQSEHFIGRAAEQVKEYLAQEVDPVLKQYPISKISSYKIEV